MKDDTKKKFLQVGATIIVLAIIIGGVYLLSRNDAKKTKNERNKEEETTLSIQEDDWVKGNREGKIVIVEYSDFECPACSSVATALDELVKKYPQDVAVVYRHYPLDFHEFAFDAAVATEIAGEKDKFWEMHDKIFASQVDLSKEKILVFAEGLGFNKADFESRLDSEIYKDKVYADKLEAQDMRLGYTPTIFINGKIYKGSLDSAAIEQEIRQYL